MKTALDRAHAAMLGAPDDDAARLGFFERLADAELFLLLKSEADGDQVEPKLFPLEAGPIAVAFDLEERLADFAGRAAPYAALPGRVLARLLAGENIALGVNFGASSEYLVPTDALDWLAWTLTTIPDEVIAKPEELTPPAGLPETVIQALATKLGLAEGLAQSASLVGVRYDGGARGHLLILAGAVAGAEPALAKAVSEAVTFSGAETTALDVAFLDPANPALRQAEKVGLKFEIPQPKPKGAPIAPGSDPDKPPRLR